MRHEGAGVRADQIVLSYKTTTVCVCMYISFISVYLILDRLAHAPMADKCLCVCFEVLVYMQSAGYCCVSWQDICN